MSNVSQEVILAKNWVAAQNVVKTAKSAEIRDVRSVMKDSTTMKQLTILIRKTVKNAPKEHSSNQVSAKNVPITASSVTIRAALTSKLVLKDSA